MSNLYTYVMRSDTGLAPNPFWGVCTLAVCTPNHQGSRVQPRDWIAGVSDKRRGHKLIYAMEVEERIHLNDYFHDERFAAKKPILNGTDRQRCGDNFYSQERSGKWIQHENPYHTTMDLLIQDTRHPWVFVARRYWYLGRETVDVPSLFKPMFGGRGARVNHPPELVEMFKGWVQNSLDKGVKSFPRDFGHGICARTPSAPVDCRDRATRIC